jgi:hypothetical protein
MQNVYKPKADIYCAANLTGISYVSTCTAYYYADYKCSNGAKGRVGNGTCQLYTTLYDMAKKACCEGPIPSTPPISPTPTPFRPSPPPPTSYQLTPTPTSYSKTCPYICRDRCLPGEISIGRYVCPSKTRTNCCASSATPTQSPSAIPISAIPITATLPTKTPTPTPAGPISIIPTKTPTPKQTSL